MSNEVPCSKKASECFVGQKNNEKMRGLENVSGDTST